MEVREFKVGDRVKHMNPNSSRLVGIILSKREDIYPYIVNWDSGVGIVHHSQNQLRPLTPLEELL